MKRMAVVALWVGLAVAASSMPAAALVDTSTTGKVCGHECPQKRLENFGGYTFSGITRPSEAGQEVEFSYKRAGTSRWKDFGDGFNTYGEGSTTRIDGRHRWSLDFSPSVEPGRYVLRAKFPPQDGYASSKTQEWVRVIASE